MADQQEYQVTARKWRPAEFDSVVGQEHVTHTLKNALKNGRLHHAYLFSGPRGVGKTTTARILAKALNCQNLGEDFEPCNVCESCVQIVSGRSLDVVEIDGASNNSVDDIRKLRDSAKYPPVSGAYKLYIIDEVHMLSTSAFNALLKTLEEPPKHLVFVFATTEPHKVPATILSRCQRFDFRRMQIGDIVGRLDYIAKHEGMNIEEDALVVIAKKGDGSMRDAQSIFDQVTSFCGPDVTYAQANEALNLIDQDFFFRVTDMIRGHDTAEAFAIVEHIMRVGYDPQEFLIGLAEHLRNYLTVITTGSTKLIEAAKLHLSRYADEAAQMEQGDLIRALHLVLAAQQAIRTAPQPRLRLELALIQLAVMDSTIDLNRLLEKIDKMPQGGGGSSHTGGHGGAVDVAAPPRSGAGRGTVSSSAGDVPVASQKEETNGISKLASFPTKPPSTSARGAVYGSVSGGTTVRETAPSESNGTNGAGGNAAGARFPSLGEVRSRWQEFVRSCDKKVLATMLGNVQPAEIQGATVRIYVSDETHLMMLRQNREFLNQKLEGVFGASMWIEGTIGAAPSPVEGGDAFAARSAAQQNHPFIKELVEKLGASPV